MSIQHKNKIRSLFFLMFFFLIGILSNLLSKVTCNNVSALWLQNDIMNNKVFFVIDTDANKDRISILKNAGVKFNLVTENREKNPWGYFPWGGVEDAEFEFPFIVSNSYGYCYAPLNGCGGKRYYFCFFGIVILLWDSVDWCS